MGEADQPRIRVLLVVSQLGLGGTEKNLVELATGLDRARFDLRVFVSEPGGEREHILSDAGVCVVGPGHRVRGLGRIAALYRECRGFEPDVLHGFDSISGLYAGMAGRLARVPFIVSGFMASRVNSRKLRFGLATLSPLVDTMVCNSESGALYMRTRLNLPPKKLQVIVNGLDFAQMKEPERSLREVLGVSEDRRLVGLVGKLNVDKDPILYASAARIVCRTFSDAVFCIIGSGPFKGDLDRFVAESGMSSNFFHLERRPDAASLAKHFDIGVLSSESEGMPMVVLEYMYWGLPCVVTDVGDSGLVVVEGITGHVVPHGRPQELAKAIERLLASPSEAAEMGARGRTRLEDLYPIERFVGEYEDLYVNRRTVPGVPGRGHGRSDIVYRGGSD